MTLTPSNTQITEIVTNLDDITPQIIAQTTQILLDAGALDVWTTPIFMKKNRPATQLSLICQKQNIQKLAKLIFTHTSAFGLRYRQWDRIVLERQHKKIDLPQGQIDIKIGKLKGQTLVATPEYEQALALAKKSNTPLKQILTQASARAQEKFIKNTQNT